MTFVIIHPRVNSSSVFFLNLTIDSSITHIRPRFKLTVPYSSEELMQRCARLLEHPPPNIQGQIVDNHIILDIVGDIVHYWSPQLNFRIEPDEENENASILSGLIGPRPAVWTLFVFIYFSIGILGFFISGFGVSKLLLGEYSNLLLALPLAALFMLTAYKAGKLGEQLGADQVEMLKQFIREAIG